MDYTGKTKDELIVDLKRLKQEHESLQNLWLDECKKRKEFEQNIILDDEKFELITHSILEIIFIFDKTGHIVFLNDRLEAVLGYNKEEVIGKPLSKFIPITEFHQYLIQLRKIFIRKEVFIFNTQIYHKDGRLVDVEINGKLTRYKGEVVGQGTIRDVSERKRVENALYASLNSYKGLFDSVSEAIYIHKEDGVFIDVNIGATIMYGYARHEMIGMNPSMVSAPDKNDLAKVVNLMQNTMLTGKPEQFEFWGQRKNGEIFPKDVILHKGKYFGEDVIITTARDITEHKKSEHKLRLYKEIIDHSTEGIAILDKNGFYLEQNAAHELLIGYTDKELVGKTPAIHMGEEAFIKVGMELDKQGTYQDELVSHTKNGDAYIDLTAFTLKNDQGEVWCHVGIKRDITKRKIAEKALRESETKYRILAEKMHDVVWILDMDLQLVYVSPSTEFTLGYTPEERMSMRIDECMVPESLDYAMQVLINEAVTNQEGKANKDRGILLELEYYHKDGTTRWLEQSINGIYDEKGDLSGIMGVAREITERRKAQVALQQSAESYRGLFNSVTDAIYVLDKAGKFIDVNEGAVKMYGYPHNVLVGKDPSFVAAPGKNDLARVTEMLRLAFAGEQQQFEFWGTRSNGEHFLKDVRLYSGVYFGQQVIIAMARDITSSKHTEFVEKKSDMTSHNVKSEI
ncbi:MAG: PAS domain S-box protein [Bacteroidales bacterium]|nr:PAS domain S-box protein [Bacteroidales bacterium]